MMNDAVSNSLLSRARSLSRVIGYIGHDKERVPRKSLNCLQAAVFLVFDRPGVSLGDS